MLRTRLLDEQREEREVTVTKAKKRPGAKPSIGMTPGKVEEEADRIYRILRDEDWSEICGRARNGESVEVEFLVSYLTPIDPFASTDAWMEYFDRQKAVYLAFGRLGRENGCAIRPEVFVLDMTFLVGRCVVDPRV
jgi:hypothetical protein